MTDKPTQTEKKLPESIWLNPLNCRWGEKYWAGTVTAERANSLQVEYVPASRLADEIANYRGALSAANANAAAKRELEAQLSAALAESERLSAELQKAFDRTEEAARIAIDAQAESRRLREAADELLFLDCCEQEGIGCGQPSPQKWTDAFEKLRQALAGEGEK